MSRRVREQDLEQRCENCKFWHRDRAWRTVYPESWVGECRKKAPLLSGWPKTKETDDCGDFRIGFYTGTEGFQ